MNQHEWVYGCYAYYLENGYEPGNPEDGTWEAAHWPVPKCLGGTKTILLLKEHHAVQGVLQSEEWQHPCIWGWELDYLTGDLLGLYHKWRSEVGRLGNVAQKKSLKFRAHRARVMRERWEDPAYRQAQVDRWTDPDYRARCLANLSRNGNTSNLLAHAHRKRRSVEAKLPDGQVVQYTYLGEAVNDLGIPSRTIRDAIRRGTPTRRGYTFRYLT